MSRENISRIVVGNDYSPLSDLALRRAFELASHEANSEVHVVTVVLLADPIGTGLEGIPIQSSTTLDGAAEALQTHAARIFDAWKKETGKTPCRLVTHIRTESPSAEIAQLAEDLEAKLIVVGTHGRRGISRLLLGSVAEGVVRLAHTEVLVVRPRDEKARVPQIEPPCPRCVEQRKLTSGKEFWCEQHSERHGQRHTYHYESRVAQDGNMSGLYGMR